VVLLRDLPGSSGWTPQLTFLRRSLVAKKAAKKKAAPKKAAKKKATKKK
jgi:hypothetical protein